MTYHPSAYWQPTKQGVLAGTQIFAMPSVGADEYFDIRPILGQKPKVEPPPAVDTAHDTKKWLAIAGVGLAAVVFGSLIAPPAPRKNPRRKPRRRKRRSR